MSENRTFYWKDFDRRDWKAFISRDPTQDEPTLPAADAPDVVWDVQVFVESAKAISGGWLRVDWWDEIQDDMPTPADVIKQLAARMTSRCIDAAISIRDKE